MVGPTTLGPCVAWVTVMTNENHVDLQSAFVLHQRAYRDTSAIVEFLTHDYGRVSLIAKGVKGKKKSFGAALQPFAPVVISWRGRGELKNLSSIEQKSFPKHFTQPVLLSALYLNELLIRLLPKFDSCEAVYDRYAEIISLFGQDTDVEPLLRLFEKQLLESLGYELNLTIEASSGKPISEEKHYYFLPDEGPVKIAMDSIGSRQSYSGSSLIAFSNDDYSNRETLEAAKKITRLALKPLLGSKPLKSRELYASLNRKRLES